MPTAILIGFEYEFNSLPGAIIDLYRSYEWCRSFNCETHIFTDIKFIKDPENLIFCVNKRITDAGILTFYENIISKTIVFDGAQLIASIVRLIEHGVPDNKLIIYYTGHGVKKSMMMPNKTLLPFIDFRDNLLKFLDSYTEIFWILDCCNPNGLHLPYKLEGNAFTLSPTKIECVTQPILLITSSEANEKSIATKTGSVFSYHFFRILNSLNRNDISSQPIIQKKTVTIPPHKNRNLRRFIGNLASSIRKMHTGYAQTVSMYSSYVADPILWMWIGSQKDYDIVIDMTLSTLVVRNVNTNIITKSINNLVMNNMGRKY
jgi:hypothetical protein